MVVVWIILGIAAVFGLLILPHNLRVRRVRRAYARLSPEMRDQFLALIQAAAKDGPSVTFLRVDRDRIGADQDLTTESHIGGLPYAETSDQWPDTGENDPARFAIQVRLSDPGLGPVWQGRLIVLFLVFDYEQIVRSYAAPHRERYVELAPPNDPFPCVPLTPLLFPVSSGEAGLELSRPTKLCAAIPRIPELLRPCSNDCAGLLAQVLCPGVYGYDVDAPSIAFEGGTPELIQAPHEPACDRCQKAMRFLFQLGDVIPTFQLADAGVVYVYGCDTHPDHCVAYIDSH